MNKNIELLKILQSTLLLLAIKIKNFHWNLKDINFFETHEELDKFFDQTNEQIDAVAEKIVMLDDLAIGSFEEAKKISLINEHVSQKINGNYVFATLINDLQTLINFFDTNSSVWNFLVQPLIDEVIMFAHEWQWKFKASK
ncbi:ferritin-like domain-containing protein [Mycoplasma sp. 744]|uniref:ferritin-like domain-containing protein n=1 Tax=Mycoplasma sp. 744 TaxID=3108531 RepID=UPI002B1E448B|nr:ferritin-like domain-containing protein [Mycoplasma sp. 744]MEA4115518.1 ferritin-like domain-containing protein [Mycoplasma sp. 744]